MADAVLLSQATYDRLMKMLDAWEEGELPLIMGKNMKLEEVGPGGMKIGTENLNIPNLNIPNFSTLNLNVCINGVSTPTTFLTTIGG